MLKPTLEGGLARLAASVKGWHWCRSVCPGI